MLNPEKMSYQVNKSGANLVILFVLINMFYTIMTLKTMPMGILVGTFSIINIGISLLGFLGSTKCKIYNIKWAYFGIAGAIFQSVRFIEIPKVFDGDLKMLLFVALEVSAVCLLAGSIITIRKVKIKNTYEQAQTSKVN